MKSLVLVLLRLRNRVGAVKEIQMANPLFELRRNPPTFFSHAGISYLFFSRMTGSVGDAKIETQESFITTSAIVGFFICNILYSNHNRLDPGTPIELTRKIQTKMLESHCLAEQLWRGIAMFDFGFITITI